MEEISKISKGIIKAAWGYFFVYFNINFGTVNILPSFVGYLLFLSAISELKDEERELSLIRTIGIILTLWHILLWVLDIFAIGFPVEIQFVEIIVTVINLYFHFQLLTNLSDIAFRYQETGSTYDKKLLKCRTVQTLTVTVIGVFNLLKFFGGEIFAYASVFVAFLGCAVSVIIVVTLFKLKKNIAARFAAQ